ncbi:MAG: hypothetical protein ACWGQW_04775 [bacterium]
MATKDPDVVASRLLTATLGNLGTGADDEDIADFTIGDEFVICFQLDEAAGPWNSITYRCRWRNVTDLGSFAQLTSSGELTVGSSTSLVNGGTYSTQRCANVPSGSTWDNGNEVEGTSDSASISVADEHYFEVCYAVSSVNAVGNKQYEFEIYDQSNGASVGTAAAAITMAAAVSNTDRTPTLGQLLKVGVGPVVGLGIYVPVEVNIQ